VTDALPFPLAGPTLIVGPSNVGKTRLTARALTAWLDREGTDGVVVFEFAPEVERDGRVLGGVLDAHAPRATADSDAAAADLAADNARRAERLFEAAPDEPRAVFVNDATIPFQTPDADPTRLLGYCAGAEVAVLNALEADALVGTDPVSRAERDALAAFRDRVARVGRLDGET
jgi:hypothetical protein